MQKLSKKNLLIQTVLASTLFVTQAAQAVLINGVNTPPPVNGTNYTTALDGNIEVAPSGQIVQLLAFDGVDLNKASTTVTVDTANIHGQLAIDISALGLNGVNVTAADGTITVGEMSGITLNGNALTGNVIVTSALDTTINNSGTLETFGKGTVINVLAGGDKTTVTNFKGGVIENVNGQVVNPLFATIATAAGTTQFSLDNDGLITQNSIGIDTILLNGQFTSITNEINGVISQTDKTAAGPTPGSAIHITGTASGSGLITNELGGLITAAAGADTILIDNIGATAPMTIGGINNAGTISNTNSTAAFVAAGAISVNAGATAHNITITDLTNSGTLSSFQPAFATVTTFDGTPNVQTVTITKGLVNSGDINGGIVTVGNLLYATKGLNVAIDFVSQKTHAAVIQNGGTIAGNVYLAQQSAAGGFPFPVFTMTGGTIAGDVHAQNVNQNFFDVTGGDITGTLFFGRPNATTDAGLGDLLNLAGGFIHVIQGTAAAGNNDIIDISGGDFDFLNTSSVGASETHIHIDGSFVQNGTIFGGGGLVEIEVREPGAVYTLNGSIFNLTGVLEVDAGTTFIPNGYIQFTGAGGTGLRNHGTVLISGTPVFDMLNGATFLNDTGSQFVLAPGGQLTINGDNTPEVFEMLAGSSLVAQVVGLCPPGFDFNSGLLVVNSTVNGTVVDLEAGSFIVPQFSGVIADGALVPLIQVNDGFADEAVPFKLINDDAMIVQPASATISFSKFDVALTGISEFFGLEAHRTPFVDLVDGPALGVAGALDTIIVDGICNNGLCTFIADVDQLATAEEVDDALDSLTPAHNYGLIAASHIGVDSMFEGITDRVWDVAWHHRDHGRRHSGRPVHIHGGEYVEEHGHHHPHHTHHHPKHHAHKHHKHHKGAPAAQPTSKTATPPSYRMTEDGGISFGDLYNHGGVWLRPIVAYVDQGSRDDVAGYKAKAWGGALGADWGVTDCTTLGAAISYTKVNVNDKAFAPKDEQVEAWMGTLYGSFDFEHGVFFDAMVAGASNDYNVNRVIAVGDNLLTAAQSSFNGTTWAGQADLGMALHNVDFFLAPFARLKWVHVGLDDYTETGADGLDLAVSTSDADEFLGGIGIRMAGDVVYGDVEWVPELMMMLGYDFTLDGEDTIANFIDCGPTFATDGVKPGKTVFDLGLALNAMIGPCSVVTAKYNLELRDKYVGNAGYLQYFYNWS